MKHLFFVALMTVFLACNNKTDYSKLPEQPAVQNVSATEIQVTELMDAGGYTYIKGKQSDDEVWLAIPQANLEIGQTIYFTGGMAMQNFESKELNRTFESILFLDGVFSSKEAALEANKPAANPHRQNPRETVKQERPALPVLILPEDVISIEDVYTKRQDFEGKSIQVYGVVWKVNNGILDRNWVHIEDGTSTDEKSSLTFTTQEMFKVGDTVNVKGKLTLNKDFGYGYVYDVLLEEAVVLK